MSADLRLHAAHTHMNTQACIQTQMWADKPEPPRTSGGVYLQENMFSSHRDTKTERYTVTMEDITAKEMMENSLYVYIKYNSL